MAEINITQQEADRLMSIEKHRADDQVYEYPLIGEKINIPLMSIDQKDQFMLDVNRSKIVLKKATYGNRTHSTITLVRLDLEGPRHRNPDGVIIEPTHIHIYKQGFGDKWAYPLPEDFTDKEDLWKTLQEFLQFCHIVLEPEIERGMFHDTGN